MRLRLHLENWTQSLHPIQRIPATIIACCVVATALVGCTTVPTAGPTASQVMDQAAREPRHFDFVEIDSAVVSALASQSKADLRNRIESDGKPPSPTIGVGDTVAVSIWQASNGQVFAVQPGPGQGGGSV